jgi:membrane-associated phospholipid phosphatase
MTYLNADVLARVSIRIRSLWPGWTIAAPGPFMAHFVWVSASGRLHWEHAATVAVVLVLFVAGPKSKKLLIGAYPLALVGLLYDTMKVVENVGVAARTVHICDLRARELSMFGIIVHGERVTLPDWFQAHSAPALDILCAVPYGTFIFVCLAFAACLYARDYSRMLRFTWTFFALNVAGFVTYHIYPAAPPWYFHAHGCRIDMLAHASEGPNLARVDAWLRVPYFAGMYGRSSDVFGAMPSLHVAYALIVAVEGWAVLSWGWRTASVTFFLLMCFSAVYLDHHWVMDVVAGILFCLMAVVLARVTPLPRSPRLWTRRP